MYRAHLLCAATAAAAASAAAGADRGEGNGKPINVLFIVCDDLRTQVWTRQ